MPLFEKYLEKYLGITLVFRDMTLFAKIPVGKNALLEHVRKLKSTQYSTEKILMSNRKSQFAKALAFISNSTDTYLDTCV